MESIINQWTVTLMLIACNLLTHECPKWTSIISLSAPEVLAELSTNPFFKISQRMRLQHEVLFCLRFFSYFLINLFLYLFFLLRHDKCMKSFFFFFFFFFFFCIVMYIKLVSWQFPQQMLCFCLCFFLLFLQLFQLGCCAKCKNRIQSFIKEMRL